MQKKSKIIIISIVTAILLVVGVFMAVTIVGADNSAQAVATEKLSLGQKFLLDLEYDKAVAEFQAVIDIEPKNVDAYIGLADAYIGMGDEEKAIETLEKGFMETGDETIRAKLEELKKPEETTVEVTTVATTTAQEQPEMTMEDLLVLNEKFVDYLEKQSGLMVDHIGYDFNKDLSYESTLSFLYLLNYSCFSEEEKEKIISSELIDNERLLNDYEQIVSYIGYYNGTYSRFSNIVCVNAQRENYISLKDFVIDENYHERILDMDYLLYENSFDNSETLGKILVFKGVLTGYELNEETMTDIVIKQTYDYAVYMQIGSDLEKDVLQQFNDILVGDSNKIYNIIFSEKEKTSTEE